MSISINIHSPPQAYTTDELGSLDWSESFIDPKATFYHILTISSDEHDMRIDVYGTDSRNPQRGFAITRERFDGRDILKASSYDTFIPVFLDCPLLSLMSRNFKFELSLSIMALLSAHCDYLDDFPLASFALN